MVAMTVASGRVKVANKWVERIKDNIGYGGIHEKTIENFRNMMA